MEEINRLHDIADDLDRTMWGHELADALRNIAAHIGEEVDRMRDLSGYESDVMAWVKKNGGLDAVREQRRESIPRAAYERKKAGWLDHIEECEEALARRNGRIAELRRERDKLRDEAAWAESLSEILDEWADLLGFPEQNGDPGKITARVSAVLDGTWRRLMPDGMEWPMFEDGEPVRIGEHWGEDNFDTSVTRVDTIEFAADGVRLGNEYTEAFYRPGERVKRPAPPVLDADGVEISVGDTVWSVNSGLRYTVEKVTGESIRIELRSEIGTKVSLFPLQLTHDRPVLDADGVRIKKGDEVYLTEEAQSLSEVPNVKGEPLVVTNFEYDKRRPVRAIDQFDIENGLTVPWGLKPGWVTHTKPEPDSWSSVWADVSNGNESPEGMMRRCRALAERGE